METRDTALVLARGRAILGLVALLLPGPANWLLFGRGRSTPGARALWRMLGARDFVLGVGALTSVKENTQGPEWLSMGAVADGVDALLCFTMRDVPKRTRLVGVLAAGSAAMAMKVSRDLADERARASGIEPRS